MYINAATGDLRLSAGSPAIDNGINSLMHVDAFDIDLDGNATEVVDIDLDGTLRIQSTSIDLGAYEFGGSVDNEEIEELASTKVYPNPFSAGTHLTIERSSDEETQVLVINSMGQMVYSELITGINSTVDTSDWEAGMYIIRIGKETMKVVKTN